MCPLKYGYIAQLDGNWRVHLPAAKDGIDFRSLAFDSLAVK